MVLVGFNDLASLHPELAAQWHSDNQVKPWEVTVKSNQTVEWVCAEGHVWPASIPSRTPPFPTGCPACSGHRVISGVTDVYTLRPDLRSSWHPDNDRSIRDVGLGSDYRARWVCESGHEWFSSLSNRTYNNRGCPVCNNQQVLAGYNDLASRFPALVKEWDPNNVLRPNEVTAFTKTPVSWLCGTGHRWKVAVRGRTADGTGCPVCHPVPQSVIELNLWRCLEMRSDVVLDVGVPTPVRWGRARRSEIDAVVSGWKIALEYDGWFWHKGDDRVLRDSTKTEALLEAGWSVLRVRESTWGGSLPSLGFESERYAEVWHDRRDGFMVEDLGEVADTLVVLIKQMQRVHIVG